MEKNIVTNYEEGKMEYRLCNGDDKKGFLMEIKEPRISVKEFYEGLVAKGYTTIKIYETSTRVRGIHGTIAYCK